MRWCTEIDKYQVCPALNQIVSHFLGRQLCSVVEYGRTPVLSRLWRRSEEKRLLECRGAGLHSGSMNSKWSGWRECSLPLFSFLFHAIQIILHEQRSSAKPARTTPVLIIFKGLTIIHRIIGDFLAFSLRTYSVSLRTYSVSMFSLSWRKNLVEEQSVSLPAHHHYLAFTTALSSLSP